MSVTPAIRIKVSARVSIDLLRMRLDGAQIRDAGPRRAGSAAMKYGTERPFADPEMDARKLLEIRLDQRPMLGRADLHESCVAWQRLLVI